jgi:hypothetical protein
MLWRGKSTMNRQLRGGGGGDHKSLARAEAKERRDENSDSYRADRKGDLRMRRGVSMDQQSADTGKGGGTQEVRSVTGTGKKVRAQRWLTCGTHNGADEKHYARERIFTHG